MVCVLMNNLSMRNEGGLFKVLTNFPPTQNIPSPGPSKITFPSIENKSLHHIGTYKPPTVTHSMPNPTISPAGLVMDIETMLCYP
ncbi:hypothetical protein NC651_040072 [Populus alba x Populus x berolinensis]|nr:hypothetical protein NC651_040072 [Populus alba x Populus x berolinensis]